jgi:hypothetical protein
MPPDSAADSHLDPESQMPRWATLAPPQIARSKIKLLFAAVWTVTLIVAAVLVLLPVEPRSYKILFCLVALVPFGNQIALNVRHPIINNYRSSASTRNIAYFVTLVIAVLVAFSAYYYFEHHPRSIYWPLANAIVALALLPYPFILFPLARILDTWAAQGILHHLCPNCHYDLRASPDPKGPHLPQCPECGTVIKHEAPNSKLETSSKTEEESSI